MRAGPLRHRVQIQNATQTQDAASGWTTDTWTGTDKVWASIEPLSGRERFEAQQVTPEVTHKIRIRWRDDITIDPDSRVVGKTNPYNGTTFNVHAVLNQMGRSRELVILAKENR